MEKSTAKVAMKTILVVIKDNQVLTMMSGKSSEFLSFRIFKRNILNIFKYILNMKYALKDLKGECRSNHSRPCWTNKAL